MSLGGVRAAGMFVLAVVMVFAAGCDALNPSFVDFLGPDLLAPIGPDSRGHVAVVFRNDMVFDEALLQDLVNNGLDPALLDQPGLRPRVRLRLRITFINSETLDMEFSDGSPIVDPRVGALPELTRVVRTNFVAQCDVARVELITLPEVFVPSFFRTLRVIRDVFNTEIGRELISNEPPRFQLLEIDDVDAQGNTLLRRNFDIRDVPPPAVGPNCGSVVAITLSGTLRLPLVALQQNGNLVPGVLDTDDLSLASSPGRFQLTVGIR